MKKTVTWGDFNAKIVRESFMENVAGKFSLHERASGNGILLLSLATTYLIVIKSTRFYHKNVHKGKWKAPGRNIN